MLEKKSKYVNVKQSTTFTHLFQFLRQMSPDQMEEGQGKQQPAPKAVKKPIIGSARHELSRQASNHLPKLQKPGTEKPSFDMTMYHNTILPFCYDGRLEAAKTTKQKGMSQETRTKSK